MCHDYRTIARSFPVDRELGSERNLLARLRALARIACLYSLNGSFPAQVFSIGQERRRIVTQMLNAAVSSCRAQRLANETMTGIEENYRLISNAPESG
jgi:hypothetical protein